MNNADARTNSNTIAGTLNTRRTRRSMFRSLAGASAAILAAGSFSTAFANHTAHLYTVSTNANFRSGPGASHNILGVISKGTTFKINGQVQNGYAGVIYNGTVGWVLGSLVIEPAPVSGNPVISGQAWTSSSVNMRSGPGTSHSVIRVMPAGSKIGISTTVQNGFRFVTDGIKSGWMSDAFITNSYHGDSGSTPVPAITGQAKTTATANLRSGPGTTYKVLKVVPSGTVIGTSTTVQNGFLYVSVAGTGGWMYTDYTGWGGTGAGPDSTSGTAMTTANVNMREMPSTESKVLLVIPTGAKVPLTGNMSNGFASVTYNGKQGWVHKDYLKF